MTNETTINISDRMTKRMYKTLEFDKILDILAGHAYSDKVRDKIRKLEPYLSLSEVTARLKETTEARLIMEQYGTPPLSAVNDLDKILPLLGKGTFLSPEQLESIARFLTACRRLKNYLKKAENTSASVAFYGRSLYELSELEDEINRMVRGGQIDDKATPQLANIRRKITSLGEQIRAKLDSLLKNNKIWFSDSFVSMRNGHYTLPVKREYKANVSGSVIDVSQSGSTYFIEPAAAGKLSEELSLLQIEDENEVRRILYLLTAMVEENLPMINVNIEAMESLDFIFAKAKLSIDMKAVPLPVTMDRKIEIRQGRHPLLNQETVVPLDFSIGGDVRGIIITGPNTGGKTVALKTIGLFSLMAQSGLHVPAESGSFAMSNYVLCDIGDGQSITENLSTFSAHMTNIIEILKTADRQSVVLLDELGSGTDPAEGMGLAVAILEELSEKGCLFVATTHYPEIKEFAKITPGLVNARMSFDRQSLLPLYRLEIGEAGESCALYIAKRLGLPQRMIERASLAAYGDRANEESYSNALKNTTGERLIEHSQSFQNNSNQRLGNQYQNNQHQSYQHQKHKKRDEYDSTRMNAVNANSDDSAIFSKEGEKAGHPPRRVIKQEVKKTPKNLPGANFNIGDSVMVYPQKLIGIVYKKADDKGEIGVQIKDKKLLVNHKRLKLHVPASELYPADYDFSIIFDTVENRKARHAMDRKHDPNLKIEYAKGEEADYK